MNALTLCNSCEWQEMDPRSEMGYCPECMAQAEKDEKVRALKERNKTNPLLIALRRNVSESGKPFIVAVNA